LKVFFGVTEEASYSLRGLLIACTAAPKYIHVATMYMLPSLPLSLSLSFPSFSLYFWGRSWAFWGGGGGEASPHPPLDETLAIIGFGLAPVTLGASIGLTVPGIALAVAGGSTAAGASIADTILQKINVKRAQEQLEKDYDELYTIQVIAKIIDSNTAVATDARNEWPEVGTNRMVGEVLAQGVLRASNVGVRVGKLAASNTLEIGAAALHEGWRYSR
jgi:hypothetical protein